MQEAALQHPKDSKPNLETHSTGHACVHCNVDNKLKMHIDNQYSSADTIIDNCTFEKQWVLIIYLSV